jgi:hypothetical protein
LHHSAAQNILIDDHHAQIAQIHEFTSLIFFRTLHCCPHWPGSPSKIPRAPGNAHALQEGADIGDHVRGEGDWRDSAPASTPHFSAINKDARAGCRGSGDEFPAPADFRHKPGNRIALLALHLTVEMSLTRCRHGAALFAVFLLLHSPRSDAQTNALVNAPLPAQQLDDLVAPIAIYPDSLVAQVLAASTYPVEIAEAQQWVKDHPKWKPAKLVDEAKKEKWDPSIKAMVAFPQVLAMMTESLTWTTQLGNAFLAQQSDVMQAVQRMRAQAEAKGTLHSTPQENVSTQEQNGKSAIVIQPVSPEVWYVPY